MLVTLHVVFYMNILMEKYHISKRKCDVALVGNNVEMEFNNVKMVVAITWWPVTIRNIKSHIRSLHS